MQLDRNVQRKILDEGAAAYPAFFNVDKLVNALGEDGDDVFTANAAYLKEHGLLNIHIEHTLSGALIVNGLAVITAAGMDFLADDGGLTAILGTVTVKLHADTIRDMLLAKAEASGLPALQKSALRKQIEALPAAALQAATTRLAQEGLAHVPNLMHWVATNLGL